MTALSFRLLAAAVVSVGSLASGAAQADGELNIYSHRQPFLIEPFIKKYEEETGTRVNIVFAEKGLVQRLQAEGEQSPADVILTVDIARLSEYANADLLASTESDILKADIPEHLRDPQNRWFAFAKRTRVIAVAKDMPEADRPKRYEDLADPVWKGRICTRPGSHVYNRALTASMIAAHGVDGATEWAQGLVDNLARKPQGNDRAQAKAIFEGQCDVAIMNNYYYGKMLTSEDPAQHDWAAAIDIIFPNQGDDDRGAHINVSGGGVAIHSKNKDEARRFLEFLTEPEAQRLYADVNFEYPVNPAVAPSDELKSWGEFREDTLPISRIAELAPDAQKVIDTVGW